MEVHLTKDADKLVCSMYKSYLQKRKKGVSKSNAVHFEPPEIFTYKLCSDWSLPDLKVTVSELQSAGLGKLLFFLPCLISEEMDVLTVCQKKTMDNH